MRKLKEYTEEERQVMRDIAIRGTALGLNVRQVSETLGLKPHELSNWLNADEDFKAQYKKAKIESVKELSFQMHELARKGSYSALAFLLSHDVESPYRDGAVQLTDEEQLAMNRIAQLLCNYGLLPTNHLIPTSIAPTVVRTDS